MIPIISVPNIQTPPPVQTSAVTAATSDIAVGSLPMTFVAPAVSMVEVSNYSKGLPATRVGNGNNSNVAVLSYPPATPVTTSETQTSQLGFTSQFMAQAFAQSSDEEAASLAELFSSATPEVVDTGTYITYNMIKYLPSNAALPKPESPHIKLVSGNDVAPRKDTPAAPIQRATQEFQPQIAAQSASIAQSTETATNVSRVAPAPTGTVPVQVSTPAPVRSVPTRRTVQEQPSLVQSTGVESYEATVVRNTENLTKAPRITLSTSF